MDYPKLKDAILKEGFSLEWKTNAIFSNAGYKCGQNSLWTTGTGEEDKVEIDIIATKRQISEMTTYLCECKGTIPDTPLVLLESPDLMDTAVPTFEWSKDALILNEHKNVFSGVLSGPFHTFNGDYFTAKREGGYQKASRQEDRSNLYKGLCQLTAGLDAFFHLIAQHRPQDPKDAIHFSFIPAIVTNARIQVARFSKIGGADASPENPQFAEVPWALYRNSKQYVAGSALHKVKWVKTVNPQVNSPVHPDNYSLPYVWVINIEHLEAFIAAEKKQYQQTVIWN